jgi:tetratricopeptide (TPR) repeat protein
VALYRLKQREEVLELFRDAAERSPGVTTYLDLALAYSNQGLWPEAEATYEKLLAIEPDHAIATHNLGIIAFNRGDTDRAIEQYARALELDPDYLLAHASLANALKRKGQYREAYEMFGRVIELEPTTPAELVVFDDALYNMASLDITMGAFPRAAEMLQELLRHNPGHPAAHYALGQALLQLGRPEEAHSHFSAHMQIIARTKTDSAIATGN